MTCFDWNRDAIDTRGRAWIIGNGPSLRFTPLDMLIGEATFAMNKIHLIYEQTDWRPSVFWYVDFSPLETEGVWRKPIDVHKELGIPMYLLDAYRAGWPENHPNRGDLDHGVGDLPNTTWVTRCKQHHYYNAPNHKGMQVWHLPEICTAYSGLSGMIQLAVMMGYGPIYLIGCDIGYTGDYRANHFAAEYSTDLRDRSEVDNANMLKLHQVASRCSPVPIYNATIGGALEVYPRVKMEDVLQGVVHGYRFQP